MGRLRFFFFSITSPLIWRLFVGPDVTRMHSAGLISRVETLILSAATGTGAAARRHLKSISSASPTFHPKDNIVFHSLKDISDTGVILPFMDGGDFGITSKHSEQQSDPPTPPPRC